MPISGPFSQINNAGGVVSVTAAGAVNLTPLTGQVSAVTGPTTLTGIATAGGASLLTMTPGAHTAITSEFNSVWYKSQTFTITGGYATQRFALFDQPTITAVSGLTVASASTVTIANAPVAAGSALITQPRALTITAGQVGIDSASALSTATTAQVGPALALTGTWITGGSTATNKPHVLIEPAGTTAGSNWSVNGNALGINAPTGFSGYLTMMQVAGSPIFSITGGGVLTLAYAGSASLPATTVANTLTITSGVFSGGTHSLLTATAGAHTGQTIAEETDVNWNLARTLTFTSGGGTIATNRAFLIQAPTYAATTNAVTITNGATVAISGAPANGTNVTVTNPWSLWVQAGAVAIDAKIGRYNSVATLGWGVPAVNGYVRSGTINNATTTLATFTVPVAADGSFLVSANINITVATASLVGATCTYTDETNTSRSLVLNFSNIAGVFATTTTLNTAGAFEGVPLHIRAKANTSITIATTGTVTTVTYTAEGLIQQVA